MTGELALPASCTRFDHTLMLRLLAFVRLIIRKMALLASPGPTPEVEISSAELEREGLLPEDIDTFEGVVNETSPDGQPTMQIRKTIQRAKDGGEKTVYKIKIHHPHTLPQLAEILEAATNTQRTEPRHVQGERILRFHRETGKGSFSGKNFRFLATSAPSKLLKAAIETQGKLLPREDVLKLLGFDGKVKTATSEVSKVAYRVRTCTGLSKEELVQNDGGIVLTVPAILEA